ncbi:MAG: hypothetical protein ACTIA2_08320 [Brevibacterium aurantiacum]|uniref:hypothetical protein n=1 Tax=Brevibacterium aurantiacum TaxID=273384 RepID=UPI000DF4ACE4|nr:hypothetical protein [Brevibacterium aurantiacum]RCS87915.1 hypothetical protein CIK63_12070 [Brevibacterium aurantiacum]RCS93473.1 hypothetical protein CIK61_15370 [Brevibacterium aurantiacum]
MDAIATHENLTALPSAFQRTLNGTHYPMPDADNTDRQLANAYRARSHWWVDLAADYLPHIEAADEECEWLPLIEAAKLALSRADFWNCVADNLEALDE